jgi:hypothetical protein
MPGTAHGFAGPDNRSTPDEDGREVRVARLRAVLMLDDDGISISALLAAEHDSTGARRLHFRAVRGREIDATVKLRTTGERIAPPTEMRRHTAVHGWNVGGVRAAD